MELKSYKNVKTPGKRCGSLRVRRLPGPPCQSPRGAALARGLPGLNAAPSHQPGTVQRALPGRRPQGLGPSAQEENGVPNGCPLVMADFAVGQGQVKFQQRPQEGQVGDSVDFPRPLHRGCEEKAERTRDNSNKSPFALSCESATRGIFHPP